MKYIRYQHIQKSILAAFLLMLGSIAYSIPFTGGDLSYKRIKTGLYEFTLVLERDCGRYSPNFDFEEFVTIGAFNLQNELIGECGENGKIKLTLQSINKKHNNLMSACIDADMEECREIAIYKGRANVPISAYGYQFVYSECCRPDNIANILDPSNTGFTLISTMTLNGYLWYTSTPVFTNDDPLYSCIGEENTYNPGVVVKNHEEYRFSLCRPFDGQAPLNPSLLPAPPPYDHVGYRPGFSAQAPLGEDGEISIDPNTGVITYTGTKAGSYAIAICVDQYKKGHLVGTNIHEIQINFTECEGGTLKADFDYTVDFCNPGRVEFQNLSMGADSFEWTFYTDENTSSTSTNSNPVMTFPGPGSYLVELAIANEEGCVDTARKVVEVYDFEEDIQILNFGNCESLNQELSLNKEVRNYDITWFLIGGGGETQIGSGSEINYTFPEAGVYEIRVEAEYDGCQVSATRAIDVRLGVTPLMDTIILCSPDIVSLNPNAFDRYEYEWLIDSLVEDINDPNPRVFVSETTLFPVAITDTEDPTCTGEGFVLVTVGESLVAEFQAVQDLCAEEYIVEFSPVTEGISNVHWTFVIGNETIESDDQSPVITFPVPGFYTVTLAGDTDSGCSAIGSRIIEVIDPAGGLGILNFGNCLDYEQALKLDKPIEGYEVTWYLIDGESQTQIGSGNEITYDFGAEGSYRVRAEISNEECTIIAEDVLVVELGVSVPRDTIDLCIGGNIQLNPVSYEGYSYRWLNSDLITDVDNPSPVVEVEETTRFEVVVTDRNDPTCVDTGFVLVRIDELQLAEYSATQDLCAEDLTVHFAPAAQGVVETRWVFFIGGEEIESSEKNPVITFPATGFYEVQLTVVTSLGCEETFSRMVEVFDPQTDLSIHNFGNCINYEQALKVNKNIEGYEITWFLVDGESVTEIGNGAQITYDFGAEGIYTVRAEISNPECTIVIENDLDVNLGITVPRDTIDLCVGGNVHLNPVAYDGYSYQWLNSELIEDVTDPSPMVNVTETTLFEVVVTDRNDEACVDTGFVLVRINEMGIADFVAVQDLCAEGYVVNFRPLSPDVVDVTWTFMIGGDPVQSNELNPSIDFGAKGYYEVSLSAVTAAGCVDTVTRLIEVFDPVTDLGIVNFGNCENYEQVLTLNKNIEGYEVTWTLIEGDTETAMGEGQQITYDFGSEGNYTVRAVISNEDCTIEITNVLDVQLGVTVPRDTIDLCVGGNIQLNPVSYDGYTYQWLNSDLIGDVNDPSPVVNVTGTTRFEVVVTDTADASCVDTGFVWVRINELPIADFHAVYDICSVDKTVEFRPVHDDLVVTQWFFDGDDPSQTSSSGNPVHTYEAFGSYEVTLIAESAQGCTDTLTKTIEVNDLFSFLNFTTYGDCEGLDYTFELNDPAIGYEVNWFLDDAGELTSIGQGVSVDYTFDAPGLYDIRVELANDECARSFVRRLNVTDGIEAPDTTIVVCEPGLIALNPFGRNDLTYTWTPADILDDANSYNPVATISESTTFNVTVELEDGDQVCSATGQVEVILHATADSIPFDTTTLTICEGDLVFLNDGGDSTYTYYWQPESFFEDARAVNPSTRLYTSQEFTVTITDPENGCSMTFRKKVIVLPLDDVIDIDYTFECGESVATIMALDIPADASIEWTYQDSIISTEPSFDFDFGGFGTFEVTARLTGSGCAESSALITLISPDVPLFLDTVYLCEPDSLVLNPDGDSNLIYTWIGPNLESNNVPSPTAFVEQNSIYSAIIQHPKDTTCQTSGRVYVFLETDSDIIVADQTEFCMGDTARLSISDGGEPMNVTWTDPDGEVIGVDPSIEFLFEKMGAYSVIAEIRGCIFMDTIELTFRNVEIVASKSEGICPGDEVSLEIQFNTEEAYDSIVWEPANVMVSGSNPAQATYIVDSNSIVTAFVYFSDGCLSMDTIMLRTPADLEDLTITTDRDTVIRGQKATLTASNTGLTSYRWEPAEYVDFPNQAQTEVIPETTTTFTLTAEDENGCQIQRSITIVVLNPQCEPPYIFVPRAFSPNGDGVNDILYVRGESIDVVEFIVYDRWGAKMFETNNLNQGWDGTFQGKQLPPDVYGYYLYVECIGGDTYTEKGNVTIIR